MSHLLCFVLPLTTRLVLYERFATEHLRGHHVRVGTPEDPATARFGESFHAFFRRTVPAQLRTRGLGPYRKAGLRAAAPDPSS